MNRSILIVICDFIVTSMIYLNSGLATMSTPFHDVGGSVIDRHTTDLVLQQMRQHSQEIEQQRAAMLKDRALLEMAAQERERLAELNAELAEARSKIDFMSRRMNLTRENTGQLSAAELQKELETETVTRNRLRVEYETLQQEIARYQESTAQAKKALEELQQLQSTTAQDLAKTRQELGGAREQLGSTRTELARVSERLSAREQELGASTKQVASLTGELGTARTQIGSYRDQLSARDQQLAFMRGRNDAMEKELAGSRDRLEQARREAQQREAELSGTKTQLETLQKVLKKAATDLSGTRAELQKTAASERQARENLAAMEGNFKEASAKLNAAEEKLRSDVLTRYGAATVRLQRHLQESRLFGDRKVDDTYFLPAVSCSGKVYLLSALKTFAGVREHSSNYDEVTELALSFSRPDGKDGGTTLNGPLQVLKTDCRVALLELPDGTKPALPLLTREELKRRGIQDLYLFKASSFGKDSTILNSRCSMSFDRSDDYLYIRNGARVSSELKAEPGDFVLTKQGELVAIVVTQEEYDLGRQVEARCFVFDHAPKAEELAAIPLTRNAGEKYFKSFAEQLNHWLKQAAPLDAQRKR